MSDLRVPVGRYAKQVFLVIVGCTLLAIALTRFLLIPLIFGTPFPDFAEVLDDSLGDMFATVIAATALSGLVYFFVAPAKKRTEMEVIHPKDIGIVLSGA